MNASGVAVEEAVSVEHQAETHRLWQELHERLLSYIRSRVATIEDAEDILQDVFLRIHANLHRVNDAQSITAWTYQITRNAITDYYRSRAKDAAGPVTDHDQAALAARGEEAATEVYRRAIDEFGQCLIPFLEQLPEHYRQAVRLTDLVGMKQTEAAQKLGLSVSGMKARVQRGRGKLKEAILDCCAVELDRRGGLVDYERRNDGACQDCSCD